MSHKSFLKFVSIFIIAPFFLYYTVHFLLLFFIKPLHFSVYIKNEGAIDCYMNNCRTYNEIKINDKKLINGGYKHGLNSLKKFSCKKHLPPLLFLDENCHIMTTETVIDNKSLDYISNKKVECIFVIKPMPSIKKFRKND